MRRLRGGGFEFQVVARARLWFIASGIVVLVALGSLFFQQVNAGLEFRGGTAFEVQATDDTSVRAVREAMEDVGVEGATVQEVGEGGFLVQTVHLDDDVQSEALDALSETTGTDRSEINITDVGPKWGAQITSKAIRAFVIFLFVAVVYISLRLEPKMAGAAIVAMFHDLIVTAGIYSLSGFVVTPATVIAVLTILGYSLYDTVVIFDRVKERTENLSASGRLTFSAAANGSLNQVLVRSLNTSVTSLLPVGSLLFVGSYLLGAETLRELALALFIGLTAGTYSSIFIATPLLAIWKEREERWATLRSRIAARGAEPVAVGAPPPRPVPAPPREAPTPQTMPQGPTPEPSVPSPGGEPSAPKPMSPLKPKKPKQQRRRKKRRKKR